MCNFLKNLYAEKLEKDLDETEDNKDSKILSDILKNVDEQEKRDLIIKTLELKLQNETQALAIIYSIVGAIIVSLLSVQGIDRS